MVDFVVVVVAVNRAFARVDTIGEWCELALFLASVRSLLFTVSIDANTREMLQHGEDNG